MPRNIKDIGQIVQSSYHRDSDLKNRTHICLTQTSISVSNVTPTVLHTVSAGKKLYVKTITVSISNDVGLVGELHIRDDSTAIIPLLADSKDVGTNPTTNIYSIHYGTEPIIFENNLEFIEISGDLTVTLSIVAYEE